MTSPVLTLHITRARDLGAGLILGAHLVTSPGLGPRWLSLWCWPRSEDNLVKHGACGDNVINNLML